MPNKKKTIFIHVYTSDYNNNEQYESVANNKTNFNCNHLQLVYQRKKYKAVNVNQR